MNEDHLRRHLRALATVNRQLHSQIETTTSAPRSGVAARWLDQLPPGEPDRRPFLAKLPDGTVLLVENQHRREVRSRLLASALETAFGPQLELSEHEAARFPDGPPVEVLEGPTGAPFVIAAGQRLPLRGLPLPHPVSAAEAEAFPDGPELNLTAVVRRTDHDAADVGNEGERHTPLPPLPTFLIIGAQKSATRWLRANLQLHPDVYVAPSEGAFFHNRDRYTNLGTDWYREQFDGWAGEPIVGESTPAYMMWQHDPALIADRIHDTIPTARLIALLRNPVERALSAMVHHVVKQRLPPETDLVELVRSTPPEDDPFGIVAGGWYAASLEPYIERFGEQLLILFNDDLAGDARGVFDKAVRHIGASADFLPADLEAVRFTNRSEEQFTLTHDARLVLYEYFRDDIRRLEELTGRDLSVWEPTATAGATPN